MVGLFHGKSQPKRDNLGVAVFQETTIWDLMDDNAPKILV